MLHLLVKLAVCITMYSRWSVPALVYIFTEAIVSLKKSEHHLFQGKVYGFHYFLIMCEKLDKCTCNKSISLWQVQNCCAFQLLENRVLKNDYLLWEKQENAEPHWEFPVKTRRKKKYVLFHFSTDRCTVERRPNRPQPSWTVEQLIEELLNLRPTHFTVERRPIKLQLRGDQEDCRTLGWEENS